MLFDMLEVGETSGNLPEVLDRLADFYERDAKLRGDIKQALTYPTVIFSLLVACRHPLCGPADFCGDVCRLRRRAAAGSRGMVLAVRDTVARYYLIIVPTPGFGGSGRCGGWLRTEPGGRRPRTRCSGCRSWGAGQPGDLLPFRPDAQPACFPAAFPWSSRWPAVEKIVGNRLVAKDIADGPAGVAAGERSGRAAAPGREGVSAHAGRDDPRGRGDGRLGQSAALKFRRFMNKRWSSRWRRLAPFLEPIIMVFLAIIVAIIFTSGLLPLFQVVDVLRVP